MKLFVTDADSEKRSSLLWQGKKYVAVICLRPGANVIKLFTAVSYVFS